MKFIIKHEMRGRIRIHLCQRRMTIRQADILQYYLAALPGVKSARVYELTADAAVAYEGDRAVLLKAVQRFSYADERVSGMVPANTGRALNAEYKSRLVGKLLLRAFTKLFLPFGVRAAVNSVQAARYLAKGGRCLMGRRLEVEVLDAAAIGVSLLRRDFNTAGSVMFLLSIGELLEEWTHKKSVGDLARSMSLNIDKVWLKTEDSEILVPLPAVREGDLIVVHVGTVIPLDGVVESGGVKSCRIGTMTAP